MGLDAGLDIMIIELVLLIEANEKEEVVSRPLPRVLLFFFPVAHPTTFVSKIS